MDTVDTTDYKEFAFPDVLNERQYRGMHTRTWLAGQALSLGGQYFAHSGIIIPGDIATRACLIADEILKRINNHE